jgi:hypothetical protein
LNRQFSKEEMKMANKYMNKCSTSISIKEMKIKRMLYFIYPVRMAIIKSTNNSKYRPGCKENGTLVHCWW